MSLLPVAAQPAPASASQRLGNMQHLSLLTNRKSETSAGDSRINKRLLCLGQLFACVAVIFLAVLHDQIPELTGTLCVSSS